jgi:hypothetical protein
MYKINIINRNYKNWNIYLTSNLQLVELSEITDPLYYKLLDNDVFDYNTNNLSIIHSSLRVNENIPAVLILDDNKTYGRINGNKGKLLYRCIPDDIRIPEFLVPYEIKNMGFSKVFNNLYVTINFLEWIDKNPLGIIKQVIGSVNELYNFYEYQLYCKSLHNSIQKFTKDTFIAFKKHNLSLDNDFIENIYKKYSNIENRLDWNIITIDPIGSTDYDDGYSIKQLDTHQIMLSIYISNVTIWMDNLNLWDSFSRRISSIYLPDRKRPMLPTILSDCLCSLLENKNRIAFVMDIIIDTNEIPTIISIKYINALIRVSKNYHYEQKELLINNDYLKMYELTKKLSKKYKYSQEVRNSREFVSYLMIFMNYNCSKIFIKYNNGLLRSTFCNSLVSPQYDGGSRDIISLPDTIPNDVYNFINSWTTSTGYYINLENNIGEISQVRGSDRKTPFFELMDSYTHITSPIRRLVDLLNIIKFQQNNNMINLSENAINFYNKWVQELDYINIAMRSIRKIQMECNMLDMCINNPDFLEKVYEGYCYDKIERNDGLFQFIVYLPEIKLVSKITIRTNLNNYEKRYYKLYLFNNEEKFKKKIRLQLLE